MTEEPITGKGEYELSREFHAARSTAISAYASFEQSLCSLFAHLAGVTDQIAGIIFFKMVNARSRIATLERLKRLKYGEARNLYFNSIMAATQPLDTERNKIVHWHDAVDSSGYFTSSDEVRVVLHPPNFSDSTPDTPVLDIRDLETFTRKCSVFYAAAFMLRRDWGGRQDSWRDIFEQPIPYPLPDDHPLSRILQGQIPQPPA